MIIYKDFLSGDEIISDTYNLKEIDDVVYEVDCQMVTRGAIQINTGSNARDPNAPTEEGGEDDGEAEAPPEDAPAQVNDVIDGFRLQSMPPFTSKEDFARSLKVYLKELTKKLKKGGVDDERIKSITDGMKKYAGKMAKKATDFEPYVGETLPETDEYMPIYLNFRPDGTTPYFTIWKHGLSEMKV